MNPVRALQILKDLKEVFLVLHDEWLEGLPSQKREFYQEVIRIGERQGWLERVELWGAGWWEFKI